MTVRWGIIGAGDIVRKRVAAAIRDAENSALVAICRRDAALSEASARELGAAKWFSDWRELVASDAIDAVYVATPVYLHCEQTVAAAEAGKHVLCEKPMAMSVSQCEEMIAACETANVKLGVAYYRHFYPSIRRVREIIESGEIGKISLVRVDAFEPFDPSPEDPRAWLLDPTISGGGPMMDFGCHRIEILQNLFGEADGVVGAVSNDVFSRAVEDTAVATIHFKTGATTVVSVTHATPEVVDRIEIIGTQGSISIPALNSPEVLVRTKQGERTESHAPHRNLHQPLIEDFIAAVRDDRSPTVDGHAGKRVSVVLERIYGREKKQIAAL